MQAVLEGHPAHPMSHVDGQTWGLICVVCSEQEERLARGEAKTEEDEGFQEEEARESIKAKEEPC